MEMLKSHAYNDKDIRQSVCYQKKKWERWVKFYESMVELKITSDWANALQSRWR